jgi:hypothetical protein
MIPHQSTIHESAVLNLRDFDPQVCQQLAHAPKLF